MMLSHNDFLKQTQLTNQGQGSQERMTQAYLYIKHKISGQQTRNTALRDSKEVSRFIEPQLSIFI
jgi:hypothetical protein